MLEMMERVQRWAAAQWWRASGRVARDRDELYRGSTGLRVVCFHETLPEELEQVKRVVDWCRSRFPMASPADADEILAGRWRPGPVDRVLITFDDGLGSNFEAARWLSNLGVAAIFFIVPSLVDRTISEYLRFHERYGVRAHPPLATANARGLTSSQLREMMAMGHRIAAHNYAHRDLGRLHDPADLRYEVSNALESVGEMTGSECRDFAIGFGQPENLSDEAAAYLLERPLRVYACHRGLNVPGKTPKFLLRHAFSPAHPFAFTRLCLEGGADRRLAGRTREMARRVGVLPACEVEGPG
jgi:peptidoglycan/xylan/chitin deacetylase (PgdA/CDA1 family)